MLLYKEVGIGKELKSQRAKKVLTELYKNKNIKVLRHPEHTLTGTLFWTHNEKFIIIDQSYAFLGGIELSFGTWDDCKHR